MPFGSVDPSVYYRDRSRVPHTPNSFRASRVISLLSSELSSAAKHLLFFFNFMFGNAPLKAATFTLQDALSVAPFALSQRSEHESFSSAVQTMPLKNSASPTASQLMPPSLLLKDF